MTKGGSIVAVSSLGSQRVVPNYGAMGPAKAALECSVRYLAVELASREIRVNAVSAGLVRTDSLARMPGISRITQDVESRTPAGRLAETRDVADVILFLVGPSSKWICGQTIVVDGGFSLR